MAGAAPAPVGRTNVVSGLSFGRRRLCVMPVQKRQRTLARRNGRFGDVGLAGVVGESVNKQVAYLASVSRLLEKPLAVMV